MKIIGEDAYHREAIGDVLVCSGITSIQVAEVILQAVQDRFGEATCRTYRIVRDDHPLYEPN